MVGIIIPLSLYMDFLINKIIPRKALLEYCMLDTLGMVRIVEGLKNMLYA